MYQVLLKAIEETESKYGEGRATAQAKYATVADETGIAELKDKIEALTTVVKSSNVIHAGMKPPGSLKPKHRDFHKFQWKDGTAHQKVMDPSLLQLDPSRKDRN